MPKSLRNSSTGKKKAEESSNQKKTKSQSPEKGFKKAYRASIYKNKYMESIFKPKDAAEEYFYCRICPKKPLIQRKNVNIHITNSITHKNSVLIANEKDHQELVQLILAKKESNIKGKNVSGVNYKTEAKQYLEFLAFCFKERLSFEQTSSIGQYIQTRSEEQDKSLFPMSSFDSEIIGRVTRLFGDHILQEIKEDLMVSPFSIIVDNVTVSGENICAFKARYIKRYQDKEGFTRSKIENRLIGLKYLEESSTAITILNIAKEKIFSLDESIKKNLVGYAHDDAAVLSGEVGGLRGLLNEECKKFIFDLGDPCHILSLSLKKSLEVLDDDITDFIDNIDNHFLPPQRIAILTKIQRENNLPELVPIKYVNSRWLSLGSSLTRLVKIWDGIKLYMKKKPDVKSIKKVNYEEFLEFFEDQKFKLIIVFLSGFIEQRLNKVSRVFQNQTLEIQHLKLEILQCIRDIAKLFIVSDFIPDKASEMKFKLEDIDNIKSKLLPRDQFFKNIIAEIDPILNDLRILTHEDKEDFKNTTQKFLMKLLSLLASSFPIQNSIIDTLDFVTINDPHHILREKILEFNKTFHIISQKETPALTTEINNLCSQNILWQRNTAKGSSLYLWDLIYNSTYADDGGPKFPMLAKIFQVAHSLPTSSACLEQSFSYLKLFKNQQRNSLQEKTLESLMLLKERSDPNSDLVSEDLVELYIKLKKELNDRKSGNNSINGDSLINKEKKSDENNVSSKENSVEEVDSESLESKGKPNRRKRQVAEENFMVPEEEISSIMQKGLKKLKESK